MHHAHSTPYAFASAFARAVGLAIAALATLATGCAAITTPEVDMHPASQQPVAIAYPQAAPSTSGAIFNASTHRPLFEDRRARLAGDTLTIQIEETVTASQQSTTKLDRSGSLSSSISAMPFLSAGTLGRLSAGASSATSGSGDGKTDSNNNFNGVITVTVQQVLPNGNLLVAGEKQIGVNGNVDVMRFSGVVNPATIRAGNVVSSTQVAEARLDKRGRGDVGKIQGLGWLSRFFLTIAPV
ncbi:MULTISPECIES: flagellar basal body L-ring protein FlgH [Ramlibacter]|uniref:Flagellar L-ring protein n=1 Tax=Ramlibacter aquaticus TaxID=2780094 RepID=A0ABR9SGR3_9BURK|nr:MULTISPECIES: flagellar basal body L-ring protein FlgH [Ramlibacter]MBE7941544.1 flagellar basal body L-ring protein FlgH [Ramlibacter aquaticus]